MDQIDKTFVPGLLPIVVGTRVRFPNHDQIHHHVYSFSRTKSFELPLYKGEDAAARAVRQGGRRESGLQHPRLDVGHHPRAAHALFRAVTDAEGRYALEDLPHGTYKLVAWHELSKAKPEDTAQSVYAVGGSAAEANFTLPLAPRAPGRPCRITRRAMSWWARSSLRTKIFLAFSALILARLARHAWVHATRREPRCRHDPEPRAAHHRPGVRRPACASAPRGCRTSSVLLASDFALKRVIATHLDRATYDAGDARLGGGELPGAHRRRSCVWITDDTGVLLTGVAGEVARGTIRSQSFRRSRRPCETEEAASAIAEVDGALFQLVAVPVFGAGCDRLSAARARDRRRARQAAERRHGLGHFVPHADAQSSRRRWPRDGSACGTCRARAARGTAGRDAHEASSSLLDAGQRAFPVAGRARRCACAAAAVSRSCKAPTTRRSRHCSRCSCGSPRLARRRSPSRCCSASVSRAASSRPVRTLVAGMHEVLKGNLRYRSKIERRGRDRLPGALVQRDGRRAGGARAHQGYVRPLRVARCRGGGARWARATRRRTARSQHSVSGYSRLHCAQREARSGDAAAHAEPVLHRSGGGGGGRGRRGQAVHRRRRDGAVRRAAIAGGSSGARGARGAEHRRAADGTERRAARAGLAGARDRRRAST